MNRKGHPTAMRRPVAAEGRGGGVGRSCVQMASGADDRSVPVAAVAVLLAARVRWGANRRDPNGGADFSLCCTVYALFMRFPRLLPVRQNFPDHAIGDIPGEVAG